MSVHKGDLLQQEPLVLLVEDDPTAREGYAEFLECGGFRVAQAGSAEDAFSQTLEISPDIVVTDIALPGRDGFSLAADLRVQARTRGIPIVAMTAYWAADVHERADRAGMKAILHETVSARAFDCRAAPRLGTQPLTSPRPTVDRLEHAPTSQDPRGEVQFLSRRIASRVDGR